MNSACTKQVGSGHCNIAFLPGLANYPTDTVRINAMTAYYKGKPNYTFTVMPPGNYDQTASQGVAQTFFTAHKDVNVFATFGDQMAAGAMTAMKLVGGYTPGKNIADHRVRRREGDRQPGQDRRRCTPPSACTRTQSRCSASST